MIEVEGRQLESQWWGPGPAEAPTLVLLHEGLGCVALWRDIPALLAEATGCGVLAYSRFGYGQSDLVSLPRPMNYMQDEALQVLPRVLAAANIQQAILVGHSDGGSIAAIHAGVARDPRILGVVMIAAHFFVEDVNLASIAQIKLAYETGDLRQKLARYHRDADMAFYGWNDAWLDPRFRAFDVTPALARIGVPVLALQGAEDPYGTSAQLHVLARQMGGRPKTLLIPGAKHAPHLEAREATLPLLSDFIRGVVDWPVSSPIAAPGPTRSR